MKISNFKFQISNKKGLPRGAQRSGGFTLVEMLIAISLFIVVVTISLGALLTIFDANRQAQSSKTVMDNLNFAIDDMTRVVRFGTNYHGCSDSNLSTPMDCPSGDDILALNFKGDTVVFRLLSGTIQKSEDGGMSYVNITSPETIIQHLQFYVFGAQSSLDEVQPYVIAVIKGYVDSKPTTSSVFTVQTVMSQRKLDI